MTSLSGYKGPAGSNLYGGSAGGDVIPKGYSKGQLNKFTPEMMQIWQQLAGMMGQDSQTSRLASGDEGMFEQMEAPAMRQFNALQGQNASRFSGMGMGARRGSGFQNTMNQATSDFAQDLQSRRMDLRRQAIQDLMGMGNTLLNQNPQEQFLVEKQRKPKQNFWGDIAGGIGKSLPGVLAGLF